MTQISIVMLLNKIAFPVFSYGKNDQKAFLVLYRLVQSTFCFTKLLTIFRNNKKKSMNGNT